MKVIGTSGQAQNGKDTIADRVMAHMERSTEGREQWKRTAFAAKVKQIFCETFNVDLDFVEKWKTVPEPPPGFDLPVRKSLQFIGDGFREIQPTVWLDQPFRDRSVPLIISDVRYVNEFVRVKAEGGLNILVVRPDRMNDDPNGSEAQIKPFANWLYNHFGKEDKLIFDLRKFNWNLYEDFPSLIQFIDVFVCNKSTKEDLLNSIDAHLMPIVRSFEFR